MSRTISLLLMLCVPLQGCSLETFSSPQALAQQDAERAAAWIKATGKAFPFCDEVTLGIKVMPGVRLAAGETERLPLLNRRTQLSPDQLADEAKQTRHPVSYCVTYVPSPAVAPLSAQLGNVYYTQITANAQMTMKIYGSRDSVQWHYEGRVGDYREYRGVPKWVGGNAYLRMYASEYLALDPGSWQNTQSWASQPSAEDLHTQLAVVYMAQTAFCELIKRDFDAARPVMRRLDQLGIDGAADLQYYSTYVLRAMAEYGNDKAGAAYYLSVPADLLDMAWKWAGGSYRIHRSTWDTEARAGGIKSMFDFDYETHRREVQICPAIDPHLDFSRVSSAWDHAFMSDREAMRSDLPAQ